MKTIFTVLVLVAIAYGQLPISDEIVTGNGFQRGCHKVFSQESIMKMDDPRELTNGTYCIGYFEGMFASLDFLNKAGNTKFYCMPARPGTHEYAPEIAQGMKMLSKYIDQHPEEAHRDTSELFIEMLIKNFPCPKK